MIRAKAWNGLCLALLWFPVVIWCQDTPAADPEVAALRQEADLAEARVERAEAYQALVKAQSELKSAESSNPLDENLVQQMTADLNRAQAAYGAATRLVEGLRQSDQSQDRARMMRSVYTLEPNGPTRMRIFAEARMAMTRIDGDEDQAADGTDETEPALSLNLELFTPYRWRMSGFPGIEGDPHAYFGFIGLAVSTSLTLFDQFPFEGADGLPTIRSEGRGLSIQGFLPLTAFDVDWLDNTSFDPLENGDIYIGLIAKGGGYFASDDIDISDELSGGLPVDYQEGDVRTWWAVGIRGAISNQFYIDVMQGRWEAFDGTRTVVDFSIPILQISDQVLSIRGSANSGSGDEDWVMIGASYEVGFDAFKRFFAPGK